MFIFIVKKTEHLQNVTVGKHFLRVNMKNVTRDMKIKFVHKFFDISYNQIHDNNHKDIRNRRFTYF